MKDKIYYGPEKLAALQAELTQGYKAPKLSKRLEAFRKFVESAQWQDSQAKQVIEEMDLEDWIYTAQYLEDLDEYGREMDFDILCTAAHIQKVLDDTNTEDMLLILLHVLLERLRLANGEHEPMLTEWLATFKKEADKL